MYLVHTESTNYIMLSYMKLQYQIVKIMECSFLMLFVNTFFNSRTVAVTADTFTCKGNAAIFIFVNYF